MNKKQCVKIEWNTSFVCVVPQECRTLIDLVRVLFWKRRLMKSCGKISSILIFRSDFEMKPIRFERLITDQSHEHNFKLNQEISSLNFRHEFVWTLFNVLSQRLDWDFSTVISTEIKLEKL